MLGPLVLAAILVAVPFLAMERAIGLVLSRMRGEPRIALPRTGVVLTSSSSGPADLGAIAEAVIGRCARTVERSIRADGSVELTTAETAGRPVIVRFSEETLLEDDAEVEIGPWSVHCSEGADYGEGDAAVTMAVAYLDHGLTCRVVGRRTVGMLRLADPGVWWRPSLDADSAFAQTWFPELPGRPATAAERAEYLARASAGPDSSDTT
ncbi:hypothetical protein [Brachybacterium phenoliresistens]|uniref:hypothetical protein n=1 Tax=Brachybacterium phenoliresistens TaxID=396014 RepID=UPI0012EB1D33|nr:hypothetical protein [Brachybacterium phenoliresistens]